MKILIAGIIGFSIFLILGYRIGSIFGYNSGLDDGVKFSINRLEEKLSGESFEKHEISKLAENQPIKTISIDGNSIWPFIIGLIGLYIAYQQWRTNQYKVKVDLFEKRLEVYEVVRNSILETIKTHKIENKDYLIINRCRRHSKFLFNKKIHDTIENLIEEYYNISGLNEKLKNEPEGTFERHELAEKLMENNKSLRETMDNFEEVFSEYMYLNKVK